jgi:hypothetical protein
MSPGDFTANCGFPDGAMPKSVVMNLQMEHVMKMPGHLVGDQPWNMAILSLPSIGTPIIAIGYRGTDIPWLSLL